MSELNHSTVQVDKLLSSMFPIKNGLKQGDSLQPLIFNSAIEHIIRRVQVTQDGLKLMGTYQFLLYADDGHIYWVEAYIL